MYIYNQGSRYFVLLLFCVTLDLDFVISSLDASPSKYLPNSLSLQQISENSSFTWLIILTQSLGICTVYLYRFNAFLMFFVVSIYFVFYTDEVECDVFDDKHLL